MSPTTVYRLGTLTAVLALILSPLPVQAVSFQVVATVDVAVEPFGITARPGTNEIWVANSGQPARRGIDPALLNGKTVTVIDADNLTILAVIDVGLFPEDIAFTSNGAFAFVTNSTDATVSVIDANAKTAVATVDLKTIPLSFPFGILVTPDDNEAWVTSVGGQGDGSGENVAILDITTPAEAFIKETLNILGGIGRPALTPDGAKVLLPVADGEGGNPRVLFVDRASRTVETEVTLPPPTPRRGSPVDLAVRSEGRAFLALFGDDAKVFIIDLASRSIVASVDTVDEDQFGIAISPDENFVVVTNFLVASVSVIDPVALQIVETIGVGNLPNEVAFRADSRRFFVTNQGDKTVTVVDIVE